jgi:hypothetical protein
MVFYKERLWAAPWLYFATGLIIPACLIVFAPINFIAGVICAIVLYAGCVAGLIGSSPTIRITDTTLFAGRARVPLEFVGDSTGYRGDSAFLERGQRLDARAWLLLRGYVQPVVKVPILDAIDPTPYWLLSTRSPDRMIRALNRARLAATEAAG